MGQNVATDSLAGSQLPKRDAGRQRGGVRLSRLEVRRLVSVLGDYQNYLETEIEGNLLEDGTTMPEDPQSAVYVADARRKWKRAEEMVARLERGR